MKVSLTRSTAVMAALAVTLLGGSLAAAPRTTHEDPGAGATQKPAGETPRRTHKCNSCGSSGGMSKLFDAGGEKYQVGPDLLVAPFTMVGKMAVAHKSKNIAIILPYAQDWDLASTADFAIEAHSPGLGMTVTVKESPYKDTPSVETCQQDTRRTVLSQLGLATLDHEKTDLSPPALWRYEASPQPLKEKGLTQFNLWTFAVRENTCFKYRMAIITNHSEKRDSFINRAIRYLASFDTSFTLSQPPGQAPAWPPAATPGTSGEPSRKPAPTPATGR